MEKISPEELLSNFNTYSKTLAKVNTSGRLDDLLSDIGERLLMTPRSIYEETGGNPGDLILYSLKVASKAREICSKFNLDAKKMIRISLLHELGKIGSVHPEPLDYFLPQESDWHREKLGQSYTYNKDLSRMTIPHRTIHILNKYSFDFDEEEYLSILLSQGMHLQENSFYGKTSSENKFISAFLFARTLATP